MLAKGAETLPNKVAHDYKALAVLFHSLRNSTMPRTIKKDSKTQIRFCNPILTILRH